MAKQGLVLIVVLLQVFSCNSHDSSSIENEVFGHFTSENPLTEDVENTLKIKKKDAVDHDKPVEETASSQAAILSSLQKNGEMGAAMRTKFSWLIELLDFHKLDESNFRNLGQNCSTQMNMYLGSLRGGQEWAAKVYDASGHYNSQFFFGNDFWLGSKTLCRELSRELIEGSKLVIKRGLPPFPLTFSVARVEVSLGDFTPQNRTISVGICLPASCNQGDVISILQSSADIAHADLKMTNVTKGEVIGLRLVKLRRVPGGYKMTRDKKFQVMSGIVLSVFTIMAVASIYEIRLNRCNAKRKKRENSGDSEIQNNNNGSISTTSDHDVHDHSLDKKLNSKDGKSKTEMLGTDLFSQILLSFSIISNTEKIMRTKENTEDAITCIHGLRFLSLAWVVMVHTYLQVFILAENKTLRTITEKNAFYQTVGNASYSVDTFFLISGLLVTFLYFKSQANRRRNIIPKDEEQVVYTNGSGIAKVQTFAYTNHAMPEAEQPIPQIVEKKEREDNNVKEFILLIIYRFIRLTPAYLFVINMSELAFKYSNSNSVFEITMRDHETCPTYWWRNILYINNFYPNADMCMLWSWYMANDTQFYVVGLVLLLTAKKHFKTSAFILFAVLGASWVTSIYISLSNNYRAKIEEPFEMFDQLYDKPWSRLGPYLIGMATGWMLFRFKGKLKIPWWLMILGWPAALAIMGSLIYGMKDGKLELWPTAFYVSVGHTAWGMAIAWIVVNCVYRPKSLLSKALSYRGLLPLSRLAYCAYLVHPIIMVFSSFLLDGPIHLHNAMVIIMYAGFTAVSYLLAFLISLAFEAPVVRLLKISISRRKKNN